MSSKSRFIELNQSEIEDLIFGFKSNQLEGEDLKIVGTVQLTVTDRWKDDARAIKARIEVIGIDNPTSNI